MDLVWRTISFKLKDKRIFFFFKLFWDSCRATTAELCRTNTVLTSTNTNQYKSSPFVSRSFEIEVAYQNDRSMNSFYETFLRIFNSITDLNAPFDYFRKIDKPSELFIAGNLLKQNRVNVAFLHIIHEISYLVFNQWKRGLRAWIKQLSASEEGDTRSTIAQRRAANDIKSCQSTWTQSHVMEAE